MMTWALAALVIVGVGTAIVVTATRLGTRSLSAAVMAPDININGAAAASSSPGAPASVARVAETTAPVAPAPVPRGPAAAAVPSGSAKASTPARIRAEDIETADPDAYSVQIAAVPDLEQVHEALERLSAAGYPAYMTAKTVTHGEVYRVRVGPLKSREIAEAIARRLEREGYHAPWVTK